MQNKIFYKVRYRDVLKNQLAKFIFQKLTKNALPIFFKGRDLMSENLLLFGRHEPVITEFISANAKIGYNGFLFDIGANIGVTTVQNGDDFLEIHTFEPNPICQNILAANKTINLLQSKLTLHNFALGDKERKARLFVPKHNYGGGFINDEFNSYDDITLAAKDGFSKVHAENYLVFDIEVRDAIKEFNSIFINLRKKNLKRGIIKIDIEGYEPVVLLAIAKTLPTDMECYIVFESFNEDLNMPNLLNAFNDRAKAYKIMAIKPWTQSMPKILKLLIMLFYDTVSLQISPNDSNKWRGDIVLHVQRSCAA